MEIIDTWEEINNLSYRLKLIKDKNIKRFLFSGTIHEGHSKLIKEISKTSDILICQYNELYNYFNLVLWHESYKDLYKKRDDTYGYIDIYHSIYPTKEYIDYFIINKLPPKDKLDKIYYRVYSDFLKIKDFVTKELNLSYVIAIETMYMHLHDPIQEFCSPDLTSPKNALQFLIHNKFFKYNYVKSYTPEINKHIIWKLYTDEEGKTISRSKKELTFIRPKAIELLKDGCKDYEKFRSLIFGLIGGKLFSVVDFNKLERIYEITSNCAICYGSVFSYEIIFIIDGEII